MIKNMKMFFKKHAQTTRLLSATVLSILLSFQCSNIAAQSSAAVSGTVVDQQGTPLIGVSVFVDGTTRGTITDLDGNFKIDTGASKAKITISYLGYLSQKLDVASGMVLKVTLVEDAKQLEELVVVGYGTQRKKDLTGAVGVVDTKEMKKMQSPNIGQALQGQVSGVSVTTSGEPGSGADIRIRGIGSFSSVGPLYVVDGMILNGGQREFNVNDIESMQVLKDASATALYGARGANGVIVITTKKGKEGSPKLDLSVNYGTQQIANRIEMITSLSFYELTVKLTKMQRCTGRVNLLRGKFWSIPTGRMSFLKPEIRRIIT